MLVVDDDPGMRATVRIALASQGWQVLEAADPEAGLALATAERPDVLLIDVNFPTQVRDGFALCRELRSMRTMKDVPIVLFTANADAENRAFASAVGASAFYLAWELPGEALVEPRFETTPLGGLVLHLDLIPPLPADMQIEALEP